MYSKIKIITLSILSFLISLFFIKIGYSSGYFPYLDDYNSKVEFDTAIGFYYEGELDKAQSKLEQILKKHPRNGYIYLYLGYVFEAKEKNKEALENFLLGSSYTDTDYNLKLNISISLARIYYKLNEYEKSLKILNYLQNLNLNPSFQEEVFYLLAENYYSTGEFTLARTFWEKAINVGTNRTNAAERLKETRKNIAKEKYKIGLNLLLKSKKYVEAVDQLRQAVELDDENTKYSEALNLAVRKLNTHILMEQSIERISKINYFLNSYRYGKAFKEYQILKSTDIEFPDEMVKQIESIKKRLRKEGYIY